MAGLLQVAGRRRVIADYVPEGVIAPFSILAAFVVVKVGGERSIFLRWGRAGDIQHAAPVVAFNPTNRPHY